MRYWQFRMAKRDGQIIQQKRLINIETEQVSKWWEVWKYDYKVNETVIQDWEDVELPEVGNGQ